MSNFYEEREDSGDRTNDDGSPWDQAADFTFPAYDGATQDTAPVGFSEVLSQSNLSGNNSAKNPYPQYSGVLGQSGLAS